MINIILENPLTLNNIILFVIKIIIYQYIKLFPKINIYFCCTSYININKNII